MATGNVVTVNEDYGVDVVILKRTTPSNRTYILRLKGSHDLWDTIWDGDVGVQRNWAKFLLQHLEDGIREYRQKQPTYIRGCLMFLRYMTSPLAAAWSDDVIKCRLATEISAFSGYKYMHVCFNSTKLSQLVK
ncbi:hypothetical protein AAG906_001057 [Vitis piasezkii]